MAQRGAGIYFDGHVNAYIQDSKFLKNHAYLYKDMYGTGNGAGLLYDCFFTMPNCLLSVVRTVF